MSRFEPSKGTKQQDRIAPVPYPELTVTAALAEPHDGRFARGTVTICATAVFAGLIWAGYTPVDEVTSGAGVIRTETLPERIEHPDGGLVTDLPTRIGATLSPGDVILAFDAGPLRREHLSVSAQIERLTEERARVDFIVTTEMARPPGIRATDPLTGEDPVFWADQAYLSAQLELLDADRANILEGLAVLDLREANLAREMDLIAAQIKRYEDLGDSGAVRRLDREALEREAILLDRAVLGLAAERSQTAAALNENNLRRVELLSQRRKDAALRRAEIDERLVGLTQTRAEIDARLARSVVRTAQGGTVQEMLVSAPNEVVGPGELIAEIVSSDSALSAEVEVPADQIGAVEPGMEARLKVMTYDFTRFGSLTGTVRSISPQSYLNEQNQTVFRVVVDLPGGGFTPEIAGQPVRPGMTVLADIRSGEKTVLSYLLKPLRALQDRAFSES